MLTSLKETAARICSLFKRKDLDREFDEELESHVAMLIEEYSRNGMTHEQARRAARLKLGAHTQLRDAHREARGLPVLEEFLRDVRYGLRSLRKNLGFTAGAVLTLAVGIAVNTTVFTAYKAVAFGQVDTIEPQRFIHITRSDRGQRFSYPDYTFYRDNNQNFSDLVAVDCCRTFALGGIGTPSPVPPAGITTAAGFRFPQALAEKIAVSGISMNYFKALGIGATVGRTFLPEEDLPGAPPVALVSDNFWERRFGRDPGLLGRSITLNGAFVTVIGVTPRDFSGTLPTVPDLWVPLTLKSRLGGNADLLHDPSECCMLYGRLRKGIAPNRAAGEMNVLRASLQQTLPATANRPSNQPGRSTILVLGQASPFGPSQTSAAIAGILILVAVGSLLLIACANVASLLLARSATRQKEIAIRLAIGAGRTRLVRQLLTESALMSLLATVAGIALSWLSLRFLMAQLTSSLPSYWNIALNVGPNRWVLAYALFLAMASTIGFGLAPALKVSKPNLTSTLKDEGTAFGVHLPKSQLRDLMLGIQVAVCLMLLITSVLLARASEKALSLDLGFNYGQLAALNVSYPKTQTAAAIAAIRTQLAQQFEALPEVQSVAVASLLPLQGNFRVINTALEGAALNDPGTRNSLINLVTTNYFETMGIPIVRGRNFTMQESHDGSNFDGSPIVVSDATARRFWPGQDPIGKRLAFGACRDCRILPGGEEYPHSVSSVVIGVAKNVRGGSLGEIENTLLYVPVTRSSPGLLVMRVRGDVTTAIGAVQREFQATHGDLEAEIQDFHTALASQSGFVVSRVGAIGSAIVGILGLLMASVGIYGTVGFAVTQRTQEIGIRMAVGAQRDDVLGLVLSDTMRPIATGIAVGLCGAALVSHLMSSLLFGLSAFDPTAFLGTSVFLATVALLAGYIPARRATKVDPIIALRHE